MVVGFGVLVFGAWGSGPVDDVSKFDECRLQMHWLCNLPYFCKALTLNLVR